MVQTELGAIETDGLTRRFGDVVAVDGLDLIVEAGEIFGFLGPNGAGKSTTIDMLLGFTEPTAGALRAYRIRRRDRWVFYGAGVWMLVYASWFTNSGFLQLAGYAVFGLLFFVYSVAAYVVLGRENDGG